MKLVAGDALQSRQFREKGLVRQLTQAISKGWSKEGLRPARVAHHAFATPIVAVSPGLARIHRPDSHEVNTIRSAPSG